MFLLVPRFIETTVFDDEYLDFHGWEPIKSCGRDDPRAWQNSVFRTSRSVKPHTSHLFFFVVCFGYNVSFHNKTKQGNYIRRR